MEIPKGYIPKNDFDRRTLVALANYKGKITQNTISNKMATEEKALDPLAMINAYNKKTADRGYNYFAKESMADWQKNYGHMSTSQVSDMINKNSTDFINSVRNINHKDHLKNRARYINEFNSDPDQAKAAITKEWNKMTGRNFGSLPMKDASYEARILNNKKRIETRDQAHEQATLVNLMRAKWDAEGYSEDDPEFVQNYIDSYCTALKSVDANHVTNAPKNYAGISMAELRKKLTRK